MSDTQYQFKGNSEGKINSNPTGWENLKQQKLAAWQPIYTGKTVSPILLGFSLFLIPLGVVTYLLSQNIQEIIIDYTNCISSESTNNGETCANVIGKGDKNCVCNVNFEITEEFQGKVYLYYALTNFYQNHREYTESRDDNQLLGEIGSLESLKNPSEGCAPFDKDKDGLIIIPCGAIANSMFNDTFTVYLYEEETTNITEIPLIRKGIAWESDKKHKFKNPKQFLNKEDPIWKKFTQPRDWGRKFWDLDPDDQDNNGLQNEDLIVWMRPSALSSFRKLHRIIDSVSLGRKDGLPKGKYLMKIQYEYEVKSFGGTKSFILTETSVFLGGRNPFIAISMMSSGSFIFFVGLLLLLISFRQRKTWSKDELKSERGYTDYGTHKSTTIRKRT